MFTNQYKNLEKENYKPTYISEVTKDFSFKTEEYVEKKKEKFLPKRYKFLY